MKETQAIDLLVNLFDENNLRFRDIKVLKRVFDQAVEKCNEQREYAEAENTAFGEGYLPSRDVEDSAYGLIEMYAEDKLPEKVSQEVMDSITNIIVETNEFTPADIYIISHNGL
jgi:hypothetical protein